MRRRFALFALSGAIAGCGALIGLGDYVVDGESSRDGSIGVDGASPVGDAVVTTDGPVVVVPPGCGNGQLDPGEGCDDHNLLPYDGCSPFCQRELLCNGGGCQAICGDGFRVAGESCDDGNAVDGDGCSAKCEVEVGFQCAEEPVPRAASLVVPVIYRDMRFANTPHGHPDFESHGGAIEQELVQPTLDTLGAVGRPAFNQARTTLSTPANFCWWFHDRDCQPGDPDASVNPFALTVAKGSDGIPMNLVFQADGETAFLYSMPQFFPLNGLGWDPMLGIQPDASPGCGLPAGLNFSFTTELHIPFTFHGTEKIEFLGDDDVWIFLNGRLALDMGGVHAALSGYVALGESGIVNRCMSDAGPCDKVTADDFALKQGETYDLAVFQAERHVCGSSFTMRVTNFNRTLSKCMKL